MMICLHLFRCSHAEDATSTWMLRARFDEAATHAFHRPAQEFCKLAPLYLGHLWKAVIQRHMHLTWCEGIRGFEKPRMRKAA
jgi:hypothetical protein